MSQPPFLMPSTCLLSDLWVIAICALSIEFHVQRYVFGACPNKHNELSHLNTVLSPHPTTLWHLYQHLHHPTSCSFGLTRTPLDTLLDFVPLFLAFRL